MDLETLIGAVTKSAAGTVIIAVLYGVSMVIQAARGGSVSEKEKQAISDRLEDVEKRLQDAEDRIAELQKEAHGLRYQRDDARAYARSLEYLHNVQPLKIWED